jgi:squalene-associated FAD-dependent desaturase
MSPGPFESQSCGAGVPPPTLAILGGGLAGLAAAEAAVDRGLKVELFERANFLGGRAGSFVDATTGTLVDCCQHVVMGCCDEFLALCSRTGVLDCFEAIDRYCFIAPDSRPYDFAPVGWLPGRWRLLPGLLRLGYLSWRERWGIIRVLRRMPRCLARPVGKGAGGAGDRINERTEPHEATFGHWLRTQRQSTGAIEGFWSPVVLSTLGETVGRASLAAVAKVFWDGFLGSRQSSRLLLPRSPLREIFHTRLRQWLTDRSVVFHLGCPVQRVELVEGGRPLLCEAPGTDQRLVGPFRQKGPAPFSLVLRDGSRRQFDKLIVAVPWRDVRRLLAEELLAAIPGLAGVEQIEPAGITAVHLWFDRPVIPLPRAALVGRLGQWVFAAPCDAGVPPAAERGEGRGERGEGATGHSTYPPPLSSLPSAQQYCQVVVSAAHRVGPYRHNEWLAEIVAELGEIWPEVRQARVLHGRVVAQRAALFSARPGADRFRPPQRTPVPNLALAGDWTATGWPATMESAVRSGRLAVEAALGAGDGGG